MADAPTIRAQVPVETPAGLIVALPPCEEAVVLCDRVICPTHRWPLPDVFTLAAPCPVGQWERDGPHDRWEPCAKCDESGWLHHGDYRVLEVRPVVSYGDWEIDGAHPACVTVDDFGGCVLMDARGAYGNGAHGHRIALPGAVPGGVALIVEKVSDAGWTPALITDTTVELGSTWRSLRLRHMDDDFVELVVVAVKGRRVTLDDAIKVRTSGQLRRSDVRRTTMDVLRLRRTYKQVEP